MKYFFLLSFFFFFLTENKFLEKSRKCFRKIEVFCKPVSKLATHSYDSVLSF